jgi:AcrR family transcriptional regulator
MVANPQVGRRRGRPVGGGKTAEQAKQALMDAAERAFVEQGYRASTMELIAREAGYSRAVIYRHFPSRRDLVEALVQRSTLRQMGLLTARLPAGMSPIDLMVEGLVIAASELVHDPVIKTIADQTEEGSVADFMANDAALAGMVEQMITAVLEADRDKIRPGLQLADIAQFLISTSMALLLNTIPGTQDAPTARRYIQTFVLPAVLVNPPAPQRVFSDQCE